MVRKLRSSSMPAWVETRGHNLQYTIVVLQGAEKNGDQGVSFEVFSATLGKENVCFVQQDNGIPGFSQLEIFGQSSLNSSSINTEVTAGDWQQWSFVFARKALSRRSLKMLSTALITEKGRHNTLPTPGTPCRRTTNPLPAPSHYLRFQCIPCPAESYPCPQ